MAKEPKPVEQQIEEYKKEFEYYAAIQRELENENLKYKNLYPWGSQEQRRVREIVNPYIKAGWQGHEWNWDQNWDGKLVERVRALDNAGIVVTRFYRKQKIEFRLPKNMTRNEIIKLIIDNIGTDWAGITFQPKGQLWWLGGGPTKGIRY